MPYISKDDRELITGWDDLEEAPVIIAQDIKTPGELNFAITWTLLQYLPKHKKDRTYRHYNEIIGVLECVKQEFYRRMVSPYEDKKIKENGDVY